MLIVIVCGLPGVGKTTLANNLAPLLNASVLATDTIRKELIPHPTYSARERELTYDVMLLLAKYLHGLGVNCILDATFIREKSRIQVKTRLGLDASEFYVIECVCPEALVISRLKNRKGDFSDADVSVYKKMKRIYEPVKGAHLTSNTSKPPNKIAEDIASKIIQR